jgi:hypothetical protein
MNTFAKEVISFYKTLELKRKLPLGIEYMNPYQNEETIKIVEKFFEKFYSDTNKRKLMLGINPGRLGAGLTGVSFTDPIQMDEACGIKNSFQKKPELSSTFIYKMIESYGGPEKFYKQYFISSVSPLGFVKDGKNVNYYDFPELQNALENFIIENIKKQLEFNIDREICFCIGEGKNMKYLEKLNKKHQFFEKIIPLAHPRFIMQYRRKKVDEYVERYLEVLR